MKKKHNKKLIAFNSLITLSALVSTVNAENTPKRVKPGDTVPFTITTKLGNDSVFLSMDDQLPEGLFFVKDSFSVTRKTNGQSIDYKDYGTFTEKDNRVSWKPNDKLFAVSKDDELVFKLSATVSDSISDEGQLTNEALLSTKDNSGAIATKPAKATVTVAKPKQYGQVIVYFVDTDGNQLREELIVKGEGTLVGEDYTVDPIRELTVNGETLDFTGIKAGGKLKGTVKEGITELTLVYSKRPPITRPEPKPVPKPEPKEELSPITESAAFEKKTEFVEDKHNDPIEAARETTAGPAIVSVEEFIQAETVPTATTDHNKNNDSDTMIINGIRVKRVGSVISVPIKEDGSLIKTNDKRIQELKKPIIRPVGESLSTQQAQDPFIIKGADDKEYELVGVDTDNEKTQFGVQTRELVYKERKAPIKTGVVDKKEDTAVFVSAGLVIITAAAFLLFKKRKRG